MTAGLVLPAFYPVGIQNRKSWILTRDRRKFITTFLIMLAISGRVCYTWDNILKESGEDFADTNRNCNHRRASAEHVATFFIQKANSFKSQISVAQGDNSVNAKSLLGFLSLQPAEGSQVTLTAEGPDEAEALKALADMLG